MLFSGCLRQQEEHTGPTADVAPPRWEGSSVDSPHGELLCVPAIKAGPPGHVSLIHLGGDEHG